MPIGKPKKRIRLVFVDGREAERNLTFKKLTKLLEGRNVSASILARRVWEDPSLPVQEWRSAKWSPGLVRRPSYPLPIRDLAAEDTSGSSTYGETITQDAGEAWEEVKRTLEDIAEAAADLGLAAGEEVKRVKDSLKVKEDLNPKEEGPGLSKEEILSYAVSQANPEFI